MTRFGAPCWLKKVPARLSVNTVLPFNCCFSKRKIKPNAGQKDVWCSTEVTAGSGSLTSVRPHQAPPAAAFRRPAGTLPSLTGPHRLRHIQHAHTWSTCNRLALVFTANTQLRIRAAGGAKTLTWGINATKGALRELLNVTKKRNFLYSERFLKTNPLKTR